MRMKTLYRFGLLAMLLTSACGGCDGDDNPLLTEFDLEDCENEEDDNGDGLIDCQDSVCQLSDVCAFEPPDPASIAPPYDSRGVTPFPDAVRFLWSGDNPVIRGVKPGAVDESRVSVLRAKLLDRDGEPVKGIRATIAGEPELGYTFSRDDGSIDLVANGNSRATIRLAAEGFLAVDRSVDAPRLDFKTVDDVVLTPIDEKETRISGGGAAIGTTMSDSDGERTGRLWFPAGTTATVSLPDGQSAELKNFTVRLTEYTVGDTGPAAMPAFLPDDSAYTYAVELSLDEAEAVGASEVSFDQTVYVYLDNFLEFDVGQVVPNGYYNRTARRWEAEENGVVARLVDGGIDLDGSDGPSSQETLDAFGITPQELTAIRTMFESGDTFWRAPIKHFSPYDLNWPYELPEGAVAPDEIPDLPSTRDEDPCAEAGSIIECQNQVMMKSVPVAGTGLRLVYRSDRTGGRLRAFDLELTGDTPSNVLKKVIIQVEILGRSFIEEFEPAPNLTYSFEWDRIDVYGREFNGTTPIELRVGYVYEASFTEPVTAGAAFGQPGGTSSRPARIDVPIWRRYRGTFGSFDSARAFNLGGWALDVQQVYESGRQTLYPANAPERSGGDVSRFIRNFETFDQASNAPIDIKGELFSSLDVLPAADGSLYFPFRPSGGASTVVMRRAPNGTFEHVAGKSVTFEELRASPCLIDEDCGEGGPPKEAIFTGMRWAIGPDQALYVANGRCLRRIQNDTVEIIAGETCFDGNYADNFPNIGEIVIGPNSEIIVTNGGRIVRVYPGEQRFELLAGCENCDGGFENGSAPAIGTDVFVEGLAITSDGTIWFFDGGESLVRLVGDRLEAVDFDDERDVRWAAAGLDDAIYSFEIGNTFNMFLKRYKDGSVTTIAGISRDLLDPSNTLDILTAMTADNIPATSAILSPLGNPAVLPNGNVYFATLAELDEDLPGGDEDIDIVIKEIASAYPDTLGEQESLLSSRDGRRLHRFARNGAQTSISSTFNGLELYALSEGPNGIESLRDEFGNTVTIERDAAGNPSAVVGPWGQRTSLTLDDNGFIDSFSYPDGTTRRATYDEYGLLQTWEDAANATSTYTYDVAGNIVRADDPEGGWKTLRRTSTGVVLETSSGRRVEYSNGRQVYSSTTTTTDEAGLVWQGIKAFGTSNTLVEPNGTIRETSKSADPRFGLQSPYVDMRRTETPSGLEQMTRRNKTATLADESDLTTLMTLVETIDVNGAVTNYTYDRSQNTMTRTSPEGRIMKYGFDALNRNTTVQYGDFEALEVGYDEEGRITSYTQGTSTVAGTYGADGYLAELRTPDDGVARMERDTLGRITRLTTPGGRVQTYEYDGMGRPTKVTPAAGSDFLQTFNGYGRITSFAQPSGGIDGLTWNQDRQLDSIQRANGTTLSTTYDAARRVTGWQTGRGEFTRTYDAMTGQVTESASPEGRVELTWDGFLNTQRTISFDGHSFDLRREFDDNFRITRRNAGGIGIDHEYDGDGIPTKVGDASLQLHADAPLVTRLTLGGSVTDYTWDSRGRPEAMAYSQSGSEVFSLTHTFDVASRVSTTVETIEGSNTTLTYTYGADGELAQVRRDGVLEADFEYDLRGNRTKLVAGVATFDSSNHILTAGTRTYQTDMSGYVVGWTESTDTTTLEYDGNDLMQANVAGTIITYGYDSRGRRIWRKVDGTLDRGWLFDDTERPLAEVDGAGNVLSRFVYATSNVVPEYMIQGGRTYRFVTDAVGSVRMLVDIANGNVAQRLDYDALGAVVSDTNPGFQPFGFQSGLYEPLTGLTRFGARDYDALAGRWTAPDPFRFAGSLNLYTHADNDPINRMDPNGEIAWPFIAKGLAVAAVVGSPLWSAAVQWRFFNEESSNARAQEIASRLGLGRVDAENAMRHCIGQCSYSRLWNKWVATQAGDWHENPSIPKWAGGGGAQNLPGNSDHWDRQKDEHNNVCGRLNADKDEDCLDSCANDLANGVLATNASQSTMVSQEPLYTPHPTMTLK